MAFQSDRDDPLTTYLEEVAGFPILTADEERDLAKLSAHGDSTAHERLVRSNLRLVVSIARSYQDRAPLLDLIQEGNIGLMQAVEQFDLAGEVRFSTFATPIIREAIKQAWASPPPAHGEN